MVKKIVKKLDPNQVKLNIAMIGGAIVGWVVRKQVTNTMGIDATFIDVLGEMVTYLGGPLVVGSGIAWLYEKVYRPRKEGK